MCSITLSGIETASTKQQHSCGDTRLHEPHPWAQHLFHDQMRRPCWWSTKVPSVVRKALHVCGSAASKPSVLVTTCFKAKTIFFCTKRYLAQTILKFGVDHTTPPTWSVVSTLKLKPLLISSQVYALAREIWAKVHLDSYHAAPGGSRHLGCIQKEQACHSHTDWTDWMPSWQEPGTPKTNGTGLFSRLQRMPTK